MAEFVVDSTERMRDDPRGLRVPSIALVVVEGPDRGLRVKVVGRARIGTAEGSTLRLTDRAVSRIHCELDAGASGVALRDLGSTNGTFVAEVRVRDGDVGIGSVLRCGSSAIRIESGDRPAFIAVSTRDSFGELVGASLEMRRVYAVLERVAASDTTLLVQGETGTGKDVVARSVHAASARSKGPFVPVDCGAIPETLFESELFGHVRGAFTGAMQNRAGAFEEAIGGTLFLDEIGEMPLALQAKLLRVLETRRVRRVGATKEIDLDLRIICATNRSLATMVNEGTFREDLYYRLAVVDVTLPPLRARREDIPLLVRRLHAKLAPPGVEIQESLVQSFAQRGWPGNVRELRNAIERAITLGDPGESTAPPSAAGAPAIPLHLPLKEARAAYTGEFETLYVRAMLEKTAGNVTRAAEHAGVNRRFFQRIMARLGLRTEDD